MKLDAAQLAAIGCITALAGAELIFIRQASLATAVISGLLGWLSHKPEPTP